MSLLLLGARGGRIETGRLGAAVRDVYVNVYRCGPDDPRIARMFVAHGGRLALV
jgi:hypothetical protein